ncbi:hypothetical protein SDC9_146104 [bioreactor metagenome]|uniref:Uncharacterized protein n=1 Tax=bioreactor metagenome TaxID=1076179 RepID=A0A645EA63_9ZZZZ
MVRPTLPSSPIAAATDGLRRSPSTSSTRAPESASAMARFTAVVVLPSPGITDEITNECLPPVVTSANWRFVRSRRYSSAATPCGSLFITTALAVPFDSWRNLPRRGRSEMARRSPSDRTRVSRKWRSSARPMPRARPANSPSTTFCTRLGATGLVGTAAAEMVVALTFCPALLSSGAKSLPMDASCGPAAFAASAAIWAEDDRAVMSSIGEPSATLALIVSGVPAGSFSCCRSGSITTGELISCW